MPSIAAHPNSAAPVIDCHSTWDRRFYTVDQEPLWALGDVLRSWRESMQQHYYERICEVANAARATVFKH